MVHIVDDAGTVRFIPGVHADPVQEPLVAVVGVPPPTLDSFSHLGQAFATGRLAIVTLTSTAQEAVDRATEVRPDVLVADLGLPDENGYFVLTRIREMFPEIPALALTAYARPADRDRVLAAGFQQHVIKPVDPMQLLQLIVALL